MSTTSQQPIMVLTPEQLTRIIRDDIMPELVEEISQRPPPPALLDARGLATELGCSTKTVRRLVANGAPFVRLFDTKRFVLADVLRFLKEQRADTSAAQREGDD